MCIRDRPYWAPVPTPLREPHSARTFPTGSSVHVLAFEFFQGTSKLIVPDNPRTGVTRACRYEPDLNRTYLEMAQFYGVAIMPVSYTHLDVYKRQHANVFRIRRRGIARLASLG